MVIFAFCLLGAGAILSLVSRVHGLVAIALGVVISLVFGALFFSFKAAPAYPLGLTLIVAIIALQVGYGLGVVARAVLDSRVRRSTDAAPLPNDREEIPSPKHPFGHGS